MSSTTKTFYVCPLCGRDWHGEPPRLVGKVGTFVRRVMFGPGKGVIRLLEEVRSRDVYKGGTWLTEVRGAVLLLAKLLGFELTRETTERVVRDYTVQEGRRRVRDFAQRARTWARRRTTKVKAAGRSRRGRGGTLAPLVTETWNPDDTVGEGGTVADLVKEEW